MGFDGGVEVDGLFWFAREAVIHHLNGLEVPGEGVAEEDDGDGI